MFVDDKGSFGGNWWRKLHAKTMLSGMDSRFRSALAAGPPPVWAFPRGCELTEADAAFASGIALKLEYLWQGGEPGRDRASGRRLPYVRGAQSDARRAHTYVTTKHFLTVLAVCCGGFPAMAAANTCRSSGSGSSRSATKGR